MNKMIRLVRLNILICALGTLLSVSSAYAKLVTFSMSGYKRNTSFQQKVEELQAGDEVQVLDFDGKIFADFKLETFIAQGELGRVFKARNQRGEVVAVKFQRKSNDARYAMREEIAALVALKDKKIPIAQMKQYDADLFVEKEFIDGRTLHSTLDSWRTLSPSEQSDRVKGLVDFFHEVASPKLYISDLNSYNIMWDNDAKIWKIVDPGSVQPTINGDGNVGDLLKAIDKVPEFKSAFEALPESDRVAQSLKCIVHEIAK
jgi:serine/threonine protein kinase